MKKTFLTFYVYGFDTDGTDSWIELNLNTAGARTIKMEHCFNRMIAALERNPDMLGFYRDITVLENNMDFNATPETIVAEYIKRVTPMIKRVPASVRSRLFWCGPFNEPGQLETKLANYGKAEALRIKALAELKDEDGNSMPSKAAYGHFSAEARLYDKVSDFIEAIKAGNKYGGVLDIHGYNSPSLLDGGQSGYDVYDFLLPHIPLRAALKQLGVAMPKIFYGEGFSIDQIAWPGTSQNPAKPYQGWLTTGKSARQMADEMIAVDTLPALANDPDLLGAAVFLWANMTLEDWQNYNIRFARQVRRGVFETPLSQLLVEYIAGCPEGSPLKPPVPQPDPVPAPIPTPTPMPGDYLTTALFFIRSGRGRVYSIIGTFQPEAPVAIEDIAQSPDTEGIVWGKIKGQQSWFVSMKYLKRAQQTVA